MKSVEKLKERARQLGQEVEVKTAAFEAGEMSQKAFEAYMESAHVEGKELERDLKNYQRASDITWPDATKSFLGGAVTKSVPNTPFSFSDTQIKSLWEHAKARVPLVMELDPQTKSFGGVTEAGIGGSLTGQLPAIQTPFAVSLGYEPTRIASFLTATMMDGASGAWLSHASNTTEVNGVAEAGTKQEIGASFIENQVHPQKIAGLCSTTLEAFEDTAHYGPASFATWLPMELTRSLINSESEYLLTASTASTNPLGSGPVSSTFNGWLNTSGTLTRAMGTDTPFDCLNKAIIDLRVGSGYCDADLILMHPNTLGALRRAKDSENRYIMDLLAGPRGLSADGQVAITPEVGGNHFVPEQGAPATAGTIWGVPVGMSTHVPAGTAIVASIRAGGGVFWTRSAMTLAYNFMSDSQWTTNTMGWRVEERVALSVPRPAALNIVTGLPTS